MALMYKCDRCGMPNVTGVKTVAVYACEDDRRHPGERDPNTVVMLHVCPVCLIGVLPPKGQPEKEK